MARYEGLSEDAIRERISNLEATSCVAESDEEGFKADTKSKASITKLDNEFQIRGSLVDF